MNAQSQRGHKARHGSGASTAACLNAIAETLEPMLKTLDALDEQRRESDKSLNAALEAMTRALQAVADSLKVVQQNTQWMRDSLTGALREAATRKPGYHL